MSTRSLDEILSGWAASESAIAFLVMIGSRARQPNSVAAADRNSDWDFQIGTTQPELFRSSTWMELMGIKPLAYVVRPGRLGSAEKVTAILVEGELDLVIIPVAAFRVAINSLNVDLELGHARVQPLVDLTIVLRGGYQFLKGAEEFAAIYELVLRKISPTRLSDDFVRNMAEGFVCDYVSTLRKLQRGELVAGQRWLHHYLTEVNFQLLHELRLREGKTSFPDARRLEFLNETRINAVAVEATLEPDVLVAATEKSAETLRELVHALLGQAWAWPDLQPLHLRRK